MLVGRESVQGRGGRGRGVDGRVHGPQAAAIGITGVDLDLGVCIRGARLLLVSDGANWGLFPVWFEPKAAAYIRRCVCAAEAMRMHIITPIGGDWLRFAEQLYSGVLCFLASPLLALCASLSLHARALSPPADIGFGSARPETPRNGPHRTASSLAWGPRVQIAVKHPNKINPNREHGNLQCGG